jgi:cation diffusion facilitator CzcD-associated flavoprotein CzcO
MVSLPMLASAHLIPPGAQAQPMTNHSTHMAVIGAGPVGLAMAKALLQHGIRYQQLEADDDLGGNWYHGVYDSAHIISSKKTTEYADFPMPAHYPDFPSAQQMLAYLRAYADAFSLRAHMQFRTKAVCQGLTGGGRCAWRAANSASTRASSCATGIIGISDTRSTPAGLPASTSTPKTISTRINSVASMCW